MASTAPDPAQRLTQQQMEHLRLVGDGVIYNDFSPSGRQDWGNKAHYMLCPETDKMLADAYAKYWFPTREEAIAWLNAHRGSHWSGCKTCGF